METPRWVIDFMGVMPRRFYARGSHKFGITDQNGRRLREFGSPDLRRFGEAPSHRVRTSV